MESSFPIIVFLDSSTYISESYNFGRYGSLDLLKKQIDAGKIKLLTNTIVIDEVKRHIAKDISDSVDKYENARKKEERGFAIFRETGEYQFLFASLEKDKMVSIAINKFERYIAETQAEILSNNDVNVECVLKEYFNGLPPFGNGRKKEEFPDAIIISKLKSISDRYSKIYVISHDNDFGKALAGSETIICIKTIKELLNGIFKQFTLSESVVSYLYSDSQYNSVCEMIEDKLYSYNFYVDGRDVDRKGYYDGFEYEDSQVISVSKVHFTVSSIDDIDSTKSRITVTLSCEAEVVFECSFFDEENSVWDSEDKEYIIQSNGSMKESHHIIFDVAVLLCYEDEEMFVIEDMSADLATLDIDQYTLIERERIDDPDVFWEDNDNETYTTCPDCSQRISSENDGGNGFCINCASNH